MKFGTSGLRALRGVDVAGLLTTWRLWELGEKDDCRQERPPCVVLNPEKPEGMTYGS